MYCGGISYRSVLGLDIPQVNVASVECAEVSGDEHFLAHVDPDGFSGAWPSVGWALFMEFRPHGLTGTFTGIRNLVGPTGAGDSEPDSPVLRDQTVRFRV